MLRKIFKIVLRIVIAFLILTMGSTLLYRWVPVPITPLMLIRCVEQKSDGKPMTLKHDWVSLEEISPKLQLAVVCSEDQNYLKHYGFDFKAIEKAMKANEEGKKLRGGSTISQQTAKNVFLWPGRSYIRKGFEVYFTLLIELMWSKERIMEVYLNSIEMGNGVYGAESAAQYWFKKPAKKLSKDESAAITAILPNPRKFVANPPSAYIARRKEWIKKQMSFWGNQLDYDKYNDDDSAADNKSKNQKSKK
ncbi:monofunctional biosynthetic peptidoglycan transglycosylase [Sphingobacteriaceae bacterium]|nr:monofunctional biosynthetic peptidoglycan transglycosylase [Sphingobacteriaceae bacterium]